MIGDLIYQSNLVYNNLEDKGEEFWIKVVTAKNSQGTELFIREILTKERKNKTKQFFWERLRDSTNYPGKQKPKLERPFSLFW